jgi:hypothetical protein
MRHTDHMDCKILPSLTIEIKRSQQQKKKKKKKKEEKKE